jgi:23S rRNA (cytosine1962-C5)-methyltransferase
MVIKRVILRKGRDESVRRRHPWIFSGALNQVDDGLQEGDWVRVENSQGETLGFGHYEHSSIAVRMLIWGGEFPQDFWGTRLREAVRLRTMLGLPSDATNAYRLVHGEGDGLPGLIIDLYNGVAVMQAHSAGMHRNRMEICEALRSVPGLSVAAVYYKSRGTLPASFRSQATDTYLFGSCTMPHRFAENHCDFWVNWEEGQKTGFFLDQRLNRKVVSQFCSGRTVLNAFCYTGAFSVYALKAGALRVDSVDTSERAIELTRQNLELNQFNPADHPCLTEDSFDYLEQSAGKYDLIILDPPAFAKHREARHQAIKGYQRLNAMAFKGIRRNGIVATFSCSQVIDPKLFYDTVVSAALQAGREIRILQRLGQPPDHPVMASHPEGEYLKGLILHVS